MLAYIQKPSRPPPASNFKLSQIHYSRQHSHPLFSPNQCTAKLSTRIIYHTTESCSIAFSIIQLPPEDARVIPSRRGLVDIEMPRHIIAIRAMIRDQNLDLLRSCLLGWSGRSPAITSQPHANRVGEKRFETHPHAGSYGYGLQYGAPE